ncbi:MAG: hypothetical protein FJ297_02025 [Planctomycetes bacterium]|nr:hypothetical protein [Planctomycetota bacterium]
MMRDELESFFADPSAENYLRVRRRVLGYRRAPVPEQIALVEIDFRSGAYDRVRSELPRLLPHWKLSPRFYRLAGLTALESGDDEGARVDRFLHETCLLGILATGEGDADAPYRITYASDVDEVLEHLGAPVRGKSLVRGPDGLCNVVHSDTRDFWFA